MGAKQSIVPERVDPRPERKESKNKYRTPMVPLPKGHRSRWEEDREKLIQKRIIDEKNSLRATRPYRSTQFKLATDDFYRLETSIKHDDLETFRRTYNITGMEINDTPYCRSYNIDGVDYQEVSLGNGHKAMMGKSLDTPYLTQKFCKTCLHFAAERSAVKISSWLLKEGAFVSMKTFPGGKTAKDLAGNSEIDRIFRSAIGSGQSDEQFGSWVCSLCSKRNPERMQICAVCGRSSDHVPTGNSGSSRGSPSVRTLLSGRLSRYRSQQINDLTHSTADSNGADDLGILDPSIISGLHTPAPSPKRSFRSRNSRFSSPSPTPSRSRGDSNENATDDSHASSDTPLVSTNMPKDDSVAALLLSDYYKRRRVSDEDEATAAKSRTSKVNLLCWASEGDEARVLRGDHKGSRVRIVTVISSERALVHVLPVVAAAKNSEEKYVELHRNNLRFVGPWKCKVCSKENVERDAKCAICGRRRGHETPVDVIERVWIPRAIKVGAAAAAAKARSPKHSNDSTGSTLFSKVGMKAIDGSDTVGNGSQNDKGNNSAATLFSSSLLSSQDARLDTVAREDKSGTNDDDASDVTCCVCMERASEYAFVPCGHKCVCKACGDLCEKCPKCRKVKGMLIRIFGT